MNQLIKKMQYVALAALAITAVSCDDDDNGNVIDNGNSIYDITETNANFTILNAALEQTGLDVTLDANGSFTVFAPTDAAFQALLDADPNDGLSTPADLLALPNLDDILLYHVLGTEVMSSAISTGYVKTLSTDDGTTNGNALDLFVNASNGVVLNGGQTNGGAVVSTADVMADNGVIHIIDNVLGLPTVATLAAANPDFSSLVAALAQEELVGAVADGSATLTVFAPLNSSFDALITEDPLGAGWMNIQDILDLGDGSAGTMSTLDNVLTYHVVSGAAVRAGAIMDGMTVDPLGPGTFTINTTNGVEITDTNGRVTAVLVTDVTATNGVVHAIGNVLLP